MDWNSFTSRKVRVDYADMAKANKIRAWARKNNATVQLSRYARDAYEGTVTIAAPWNEGASVTDAKVATLRAIL